jgi:N-acetylglucosaminyldiphosphoundecaprenol N-acetyl-beta-D-mannosaminyltransferase
LKRSAPDEFSTGSVRVERILGHPVHPVSKAQAVEAVVVRAGGQAGAYVCLTNAHTTVESQRSPALRTAVEGAFLSVPDGMPLTWILRRRGFPQTEKVTGIEYIPMVARRGLDFGLRHFLYGGAQGVAVEASTHLEQLVPGVQVVGTTSPPFDETFGWTTDDLEQELLHTKPHILWVGLGAPKQELWMARMAGELGVPVMVGVGAAFDYLAGTKAAAPTLLRHSGFEWLFRLAVEPKRLWRRYLIGNSTFLWLVAREWLVGTSHRRRGRNLPGRNRDGTR